MARLRTVEAPARSDVYFGMVVCSFVAMLVAIGFLLAEMTFTYEWQSTPPALAAPALPNKPARTAAAPGGTTLAPVETPKPVVALKPEETPAPPTEAAPPAPIPSALTAKPSPAPTVPTVPAPETPKPAPTSTGPTPGFQFPKR